MSQKKSQQVPSEDNGFELRRENMSTVAYPANMTQILPGTNRYPKEKNIYISLEASDPCTIQIEVTQNYKEGRIPKKNTKNKAIPKFTQGEEAKVEAIHSTVGAQMTVNNLLHIRGQANDTPPVRNPYESTKLINEKITSMIHSDDEIKKFFGMVELLNKKRRREP